MEQTSWALSADLLTVASWRPAEGRHNIWEIVVHMRILEVHSLSPACGEARGFSRSKGQTGSPNRSRLPEELLEADVAMFEGVPRTFSKPCARFSLLRMANSFRAGKQTYRDWSLALTPSCRKPDSVAETTEDQ